MGCGSVQNAGKDVYTHDHSIHSERGSDPVARTEKGCTRHKLEAVTRPLGSDRESSCLEVFIRAMQATQSLHLLPALPPREFSGHASITALVATVVTIIRQLVVFIVRTIGDNVSHNIVNGNLNNTYNVLNNTCRGGINCDLLY